MKHQILPHLIQYIQNTQANIWATSQIFNTLVELDENAEIQPSLAKSWIISECGTTYKFFLEMMFPIIYQTALETIQQEKSLLMIFFLVFLE